MRICYVLYTQAKCDLMLHKVKRVMGLVMCITAKFFLYTSLNLRYSFHCYGKTLPCLPLVTYPLLHYPENVGYMIIRAYTGNINEKLKYKDSLIFRVA
jgi:hypothetical protein